MNLTDDAQLALDVVRDHFTEEAEPLDLGELCDVLQCGDGYLWEHRMPAGPLKELVDKEMVMVFAHDNDLSPSIYPLGGMIGFDDEDKDAERTEILVGVVVVAFVACVSFFAGWLAGTFWRT